MRRGIRGAEVPFKATQADIARMAGVSQQCVSQALNGSGRLTPGVREHILSVARRAKYQPNRLAKALRGRSYGTVGLIGLCNRPRSHVSNILLQNMQIELMRKDKFLTYVPVSAGDSGALDLSLENLSIDGAFISFDMEFHGELSGAFESCGIPEVWINSKREFNCVYPDDYRGAYEVTEFLIDRGFEDICYVGKAGEASAMAARYHYSIHDRHRGYLDAAMKSGFDGTALGAGEISAAFLRKFAGKGPRRRKVPPVIICYEYYSALNTLIAAKEAGISVPEGLRIVYFHPQPHFEDYLDSLMRCYPIPTSELASNAVSMFESKVESKTSPVASVPVPYDKSYLELLVNTESYLPYTL